MVRAMQIRKIEIIAILMVFSLISTGGCTTTYLYMKDWEGQPIDELYWDLGKADKVEDLNTYERVHTWYSTWTDDGQVKTCQKSFYTRNDGHAEVIINTSYSDCPYLTPR